MELQYQPSSISQLIRKLEEIGYEYFEVESEDDLIANLRRQVERINGITLSEVDFAKVMGHICCLKNGDSGHSTEAGIEIRRNNGDLLRIDVLDRKDWSQNKFQFARKLSSETEEADPYAVVLYVNGLPFANVDLRKMDMVLGMSSAKVHSYDQIRSL